MKCKPILLLCLAIIITGLLYVIIQVRSITSKSIIPTKNKPEEVYVTLDQKLAHKKPFSVLLMGYAGGKHDGTYLTDSMIAARIDPAAKKVNLVSIPRNTWITLPSIDGT